MKVSMAGFGWMTTALLALAATIVTDRREIAALRMRSAPASSGRPPSAQRELCAHHVPEAGLLKERSQDCGVGQCEPPGVFIDRSWQTYVAASDRDR